MGITKRLLFLSLLCIFFTSCSTLQELASVQKPGISISDVNISGLSLQNIELLFDVEVDNPNPLSIDLDSYEYDFLIGQNSFVKGSQTVDTEILASSKSIVQVPISFTFQELYDIFGSLKDQDETTYTLDTKVGVNVPVLGLMELPVKKEGTLPVVKPPSISLGKLSVKDLSFTKADLELELKIDNPNAFGLIMNTLDYAVDINGFSAITGSSNKRIEIGNKESGNVKIPVSFNLLQLGVGAYQVLKSGNPLNYNLSGNANVGATYPLFQNSPFDFAKSGVVNLNN